MKTFQANASSVERKWYVINAEGKVLGRMASEIAKILRGKHKPIYTPNVDTGDHVVVVNAEKVKLTGNKLKGKIYYNHSLYPGGLKETTAEIMLQKKPEEVIRLAIKGMLPKTTLGKAMITKLKIYKGGEHPHQAQKPEELEF